jgi:crotonobetainyl-CoA:carnitine CoA-transferase CaiB-like acyl-CoA transferase
VVSSLSPRQAQRLDLEYGVFRALKDLPVVRITNFGPNGPYRDYQLSETVLFAMGGEMFSHGLADREPLKLGGTAALLQCGAMAAIAALGAIHAYELHGIGQRVDVPLFDAQINSIDRRSSCILAYRWSGRVQQRAAGTGAGIAGGIYPCADGYVEVTASFGNYWNRFVEMIGDPVLMEPRWSDPATVANPASKEEADGIVYPWMLARSRQEIWAEARRAHALVAPLFTGVEIANDHVFRERGLWDEIEHQTLGRLPMLGRPYMLERTPWRLRKPAPALGADTRKVLEEAGLSEPKLAEAGT